MRFALQFNFDYHTTIITVLWALGWSMLTLAGLIWLPLWAIILFGTVLVVGHNVELFLKDARRPAECQPRKVITTTGPDSVGTTTSPTKPARA